MKTLSKPTENPKKRGRPPKDKQPPQYTYMTDEEIIARQREVDEILDKCTRKGAKNCGLYQQADMYDSDHCWDCIF